MEMELDTTPAQKAKQVALIRDMSFAARAAALVALCDGVRELAGVQIRGAHPLASEAEFRGRLALRVYGRPYAEARYGPIAADAR